MLGVALHPYLKRGGAFGISTAYDLELALHSIYLADGSHTSYLTYMCLHVQRWPIEATHPTWPIEATHLT